MSLLCKIDDKILLNNMNDENIRLNREESEEDHHMLSANDHDEKRMRRQIANSNERRRMQSINAGFQSLRQLLPHHEGEKLSKAAILQQTAEYIYNLEQEKTRLLSQNCTLKRLLDTHDGVSGGELQTVLSSTTTTSTAGVNSAAIATMNGINTNTALGKKRKVDIFAIQAISDSSDEGLGSMSPEPVSLMNLHSSNNNAGGGGGNNKSSSINVTAKDYLDMKQQLDVERRQKLHLEEQLRQLENQLYADRNTTIQYKSQQEIIDHTIDTLIPDEVDGMEVATSIEAEDEDDIVEEEEDEEMEKMAVAFMPEQQLTNTTTKLAVNHINELQQSRIHLQQQHHQDIESLQMYTIESISNSDGQPQVLVCTGVEETTTQDLSPHNNIVKEEKIIITTNRQSSKSPITSVQIVDKPIQQLHIQQHHHHHHHHHTQQQQQQQQQQPQQQQIHAKRIPTILETVIKAEPKVEVERIGSPASSSSIIVTTTDEASANAPRPTSSTTSRAQMYHINTNTSRQNLETIVEAIRHLEGDNAFDIVEPAQEVPLALTTNKQQREQTKLQQQQKAREHRQIQLEINPFLHFKNANITGTLSSSTPSASAITVAAASPANRISSPATTFIPVSTISVKQISVTPTVVTHQQNSQIIAAPASSSTIVATAASIHQQQQCRPGVIVVKQNS